MSGRRCPHCGGLVGADAEWCGQCLTRLDVPAAEPPAPPGPDVEEPGDRSAEAPSNPVTGDGAAGFDVRGDGPRPAAVGASAGGRAVRKTEEGIVWDCPTCGEVNPIESGACTVCGTAFSRIFEPPDQGPAVDPGRAAALSLVFPGAGHVVAGRRADGIARGVVFTFAVATGLLTLIAGPSGNAMLLAVMVLSLGTAAALYVLSTLDAGRAAQRLPPIVTTRMLLYGAVGLMLVTLVLLTVATMQTAPSPAA